MQVYSVEEQPLPYLVMEYIDGQTLQQKLNDGAPLDVPEILHLGRQVAAGLAAAHAMTLIHRDIKPGNILLESGPEQKVKITDFGLARAADDASMTQTGAVCGTPMYMAPEQAQGMPLDTRTDLFSLGSVLYQMAGGRPPFRAPTAIAVLRRVVDEAPRPLQEIIPEVPDWLAAIVMKLLEKQPANRYQTAKEVADLLGKCQTELQQSGKVTCVPQPPKAVVQPVAEKPTPVPVSLPQSSVGRSASNRGLLAVVAAIVVVVAGLAASEYTGRTHITSLGRNKQPIADPALNMATTTDPATESPTTPTNDQRATVPPLDVQPTAATGWQGWPTDAPPPAIAPFDADQAKAHQEAWAKYLGVPVEYTNSIGMKFRLIPPGEFMMGSTEEESAEVLKEGTFDTQGQRLIRGRKSKRPVSVIQPTYLGETEVTQAEYATIMHSNPSSFSSYEAATKASANNCPVETVDFFDAATFCAKLNQSERLLAENQTLKETAAPSSVAGYKLPNEAQWEFSCRGGTTTKFWCGADEDELGVSEWYVKNASQTTHPVAALRANPFGLFDMHGNVLEWVQGSTITGETNGVNDGADLVSQGELSDELHVYRGGSWWHTAVESTSASWFAKAPTTTGSNLGFRVALSVDAIKEFLARSPSTTDAPQVAADNEPPIDYAAERKAAEKILLLGGGMVLENSLGQKIRGQYDRSPTLPDQPFYIVEMHCYETKLKDEDLSNFADCKKLRVAVVAGNFNITTDGLKHLAGCPLTKLDAAYERVNEGFGGLLCSWPNLEHLIVTGVSDEGLSGMPNLPKLSNLVIQDSTVSDAGLTTLVAKCPNLKTISIAVGPRTLRPLKGLKHLAELECSGGQVDEAGIRAIADLSRLDTITFLADITDQSIADLAPLCDRLLKLHLFSNRDWDVGISEAGFRSVGKLRNLQAFTFGGIKGVCTDRGLEALAELPDLKFVRLYPSPQCNQVTANGLATFRRLRPDIEFQWNPDKAGRNYPALSSWPEAEDGTIAEWKLPTDAPPPAVAPFSAEEAQQHQAAWAKYLGKEVELKNKLGMKFRLIPPGDVVDETPVGPQLVRLEQPYYLGTTEVTHSQFERFVNATNYKTAAEMRGIGRGVDWTIDPTANWRSTGFVVGADTPVTHLVAEDIHAFCEWLSKSDGATYRLPMHDEWAIAARAGGGDLKTGWCVTADEQKAAAWLKETLSQKNLSGPQPVAGRLPNPFGLYDVVGNVYEYCELSLDGRIPLGVRGGGYQSEWIFKPQNAGEYCQPNTGFRVVRQVSSEPSPTPKPFSKPLLTRHAEPLSDFAMVSHPAKVDGVRSWSVEPIGHWGGTPPAIAWSPADDLIATASVDDGSVRLWDRQGSIKRLLLGHRGNVTCVAFSSNGKLLASGDRFMGEWTPSGESGNSQNTVRIWEVATGKCLGVIPTGRWCWGVAFSPDGNELAHGGNDYLRIVNLQTGGSREVPRFAGIARSTWSPDGKRLLLTLGGLLRVIDASSMQDVGDLTAPPGTDGAVQFSVGYSPTAGGKYSPDGKWIAASGSDGNVHLWDAESLEHKKSVSAKGLKCLAWHKESGKLAATGESGGLMVFDVESTDVLLNTDFGGPAGDLAWSPEGTEIASHIRGSIAICTLETEKIKRLSANGMTAEHFGSVSPNGKRLSIFGGPMFALDPGSLILHTNSDGGHSHWSPNSERCVLASGTQLTVLDSEGNTLTRIAQPCRHGAATWSPDSMRFAAIAEENLVRISDVGGKTLHDLVGHDGPVDAIAWSPDGRFIASLSFADQSVQIWDADSGKRVQKWATFPQPLAAMFPNATIAWLEDSSAIWIPLGNSAVKLNVATGHCSMPEEFSNGNKIVSLTADASGDRVLVREGYSWTFLWDDFAGKKRLLGQNLGWRPSWQADGRHFVGNDRNAVRGFDIAASRHLGSLYAQLGREDDWHWLLIGPTGHYRGGPAEKPGEGTNPAEIAAIEKHLVIVAQLDDGSNITLTPQEFRDQFGWRNDPEKATLLGTQ